MKFRGCLGKTQEDWKSVAWGRNDINTVFIYDILKK